MTAKGKRKALPAKRDPEPQLGPAMRVLPDKWRAAVDALFLTNGDRSQALRLAGYVAKPESINVMASRIFADDRVRRAIREECDRRIQTCEPELISVTRNILHNPGEKAADRLRAAGMLWDRSNPVVHKHQVEVEHHITDDERDVQHYLALKRLGAPRDAFIARFGPNGLGRVEAMIAAEEARRRQLESPVIEADYQEITDREDNDFELGRLAAEIEQAARDGRRFRAMDHWVPYPKQAQFFATGQRFRERGLFAGTQLGKSESAAFEMSCHLTGRYPPDWPGRKWDRPIRAWAVGENLKMSRDVQQKKLCGEPGNVEAFGSGMIPKSAFIGDPVLARGEANAYDTIQVRHVSGGISVLKFRTYQAGQAALQGETLDVVWCDEEPADYAVYAECLARVTATGGMLLITFTPLKGMSEISARYRNEFSPDRTYVQFGIDDIPADGHIKPEDRAMIVGGYPIHERDARSKGEPMLGSGKIYQTPESLIIEDLNPLEFPRYWRWGAGIDLGIDHPWAYVLLCHDVDQDVLHIVAELRVSGQTPGQHYALIRALEMRTFGRQMHFPVAWPADAGTRDRGSGEPVKNLYKQYGLRMMAESATHANLKGAAANSLEGGVQEIDLREKNSKLKVSRSCVNYLEERRLYHRKDGEIVRLRDDTLAAARYGIMMKRFFKQFAECDSWEHSWRPVARRRRDRRCYCRP
jgi:phage terminase large subunit-like protein